MSRIKEVYVMAFNGLYYADYSTWFLGRHRSEIAPTLEDLAVRVAPLMYERIHFTNLNADETRLFIDTLNEERIKLVRDMNGG